MLNVKENVKRLISNIYECQKKIMIDRRFIRDLLSEGKGNAVLDLQNEIKRLQEKIIDFLRRKHDYISGDMLSHRLGISRQALWKHIQVLKDSGYDIAAIPHLGYKLESIPDRLFPSEVKYGLNTKIGKYSPYIDSENSICMGKQLKK